MSSILANSTAGATRSLKQDLRANLADGAGFSVMMGAGEAYLPAFALALGLGEVLSGLVASVPMLAGAMLQLASPAAVRRLGSHKQWVVICATCQALSFVPLIIAALVGRMPALGVFAVASVYWACGLATGPAWNTWMEGLVPRSIRPRFFAFRTRITQAGMVTGLLAGGIALQVGKGNGAPLLAFAVLFTAAFLGRSLSAFFLSQQSEPTPSPERLNGIHLSQVLSRFRRGSGNGILFYLLSVQAAVWLSGPYFTPYMLKKLHLSYGEFAMLTAAAVSAKVLSLPFFGRYAQRAGTRRLLWIGGLGIVPLSGLWLVSNDFWYLMVLQITGGVAWAAYELAMFLLFFETIDAKERTGVLTIYNVGNALATVGGSLVGWTMLKLLGESQSAYLTLFVASSFCRIGALLLLARVTGVMDTFRLSIPVVMRTVSISPGMGSIDRPVLSSIPRSARQPITSLPIVSTAAASAMADVVPAPKPMPAPLPKLPATASTSASVAS